MRNLRLDYVDLFSIHGINTDEHLDQTLRPGGCLEARASSSARAAVPTSLFHARAAPRDFGDHRDREFDYVNLHWYW